MIQQCVYLPSYFLNLYFTLSQLNFLYEDKKKIWTYKFYTTALTFSLNTFQDLIPIIMIFVLYERPLHVVGI